MSTSWVPAMGSTARNPTVSQRLADRFETAPPFMPHCDLSPPAFSVELGGGLLIGAGHYNRFKLRNSYFFVSLLMSGYG